MRQSWLQEDTKALPKPSWAYLRLQDLQFLQRRTPQLRMYCCLQHIMRDFMTRFPQKEKPLASMGCFMLVEKYHSGNQWLRVNVRWEIFHALRWENRHTYFKHMSNVGNHRIIETLRLEKALKIIQRFDFLLLLFFSRDAKNNLTGSLMNTRASLDFGRVEDPNVE